MATTTMSGFTSVASLTRPGKGKGTYGRRTKGTPASVLTRYKLRVTPETRVRESNTTEMGIDEIGFFIGSGEVTPTEIKVGDLVTITAPPNGAYMGNVFRILDVTKLPGHGGTVHHMHFKMKKES